MRPALLLIDFQYDFLRAEGMTPHASALVDAAARLLALWRENGLLVIHIWTSVNPMLDNRMPHWKKSGHLACLLGSEGHATPPSLLPLEGETVIHKTFFSGFSSDILEPVLRSAKVDALVLAGIHLHGCIRSTALDAYAKNFQVIIAEEAVGGYDDLHGSMTQSYLDGRAAVFHTSVQIIHLLKGDLLPPPLIIADIEKASNQARLAGAAWQEKPRADRESILESLAEKIAFHKEELASILVEDIFKPVTLAHGEVRRSIDLIRAVLKRGQPEEFAGWRRLPHGVVALISPFNNPLAIPIGKGVPALLFGNAVIWKPAPTGTRIALRIAELWAETGAPSDLLQVIPGGKSAAVECMKYADAVSLSGSPEAGRIAQLVCAERFIPLQAELGGNNAAIIWSDADLVSAAAAVADGAFAFAGQRCTANRRVVVETSIHQQFIELLRAHLQDYLPDDLHNPETRIGPLISAESRERLILLLERAVRDGCEIFTSHTLSDAAKRWIAPVIVVAPSPDLEIVQEESFGPILVVQKAADWTEALALCQGVRQGLAAACFTNDYTKIDYFLSQIKCGILKINQSTADAGVDLPFGGWKSSGVGPAEHGAGNLEFFTRMQAIYR